MLRVCVLVYNTAEREKHIGARRRVIVSVLFPQITSEPAAFFNIAGGVGGGGNPCLLLLLRIMNSNERERELEARAKNKRKRPPLFPKEKLPNKGKMRALMQAKTRTANSSQRELCTPFVCNLGLLELLM
jgi:hypothetical protein